MSHKKYVTLSEGNDFRTISKILTENGYKMNHATVRNQLMTAIEKILKFIAVETKNNIDYLDIDSLLKNSNIHEYLSDILYAAFKEEKEEGSENGKV